MTEPMTQDARSAGTPGLADPEAPGLVDPEAPAPGPRHGGADEVRRVVARQHEELRRRIDAVKAQDRAVDESLRELLRYLAAHEVAEQNSLHPVLGRGSTEDGDVGARVAEEREVTDAVERFEQLDPTGPEFEDAFADWAVALVAHAEAEERDELGARLDELDETETTMVLRLLDQVDAIAGSEAMEERVASRSGFAGLVDAARLEVSRRLD